MTVHELYAEKQKRYQDYQVQLGVYEQRLEDSKAKVLAAITSLQEASKNIPDVGIRSCLESLAQTVLESEDSLSDPAVLSSIQSRLGGITASLESAIKEALQ